jgi:hypothetical protein
MAAELRKLGVPSTAITVCCGTASSRHGGWQPKTWFCGISIKKATHAIPVVFVQVPDPVDLGIVTSIARPAQNITGFSHFELAFGAKWLEVLKEIAPQVRRVLAVAHPDHPALPGFTRSMAEAGSSLGVDVTPAGVRNAAEVETTIEDFARAPEGGLIVLPSPIAPMNRDLIVALVWFQGRGDLLHDYKDAEGSFPGNEPQRFVANYRKAGGEITLEYIDAERHAGHAPDLSKTGDMFERMVAFVGRYIRVDR